jgi:hypothetical protein
MAVFYAGALSMLIENDEDVKLERLFKVSGESQQHPRVTGISIRVRKPVTVVSDVR